MRDVLAEQMPQLADHQPDLVTCGAGANDILFSAPAKLFADLRELLAAVPDNTVCSTCRCPPGSGGSSAA